MTQWRARSRQRRVEAAINHPALMQPGSPRKDGAMPHEMMDLAEVADYLQRDTREVTKLASRGHLPAHRVGGEWRFSRSEVNHWLEGQLSGYSEQQLTDLEKVGVQGPLLGTLLNVASIAVPMRGSTRASILKELVTLTEQTWQVFDPEALLEAVRAREELVSTALPAGVAIPHPRRPLPPVLGESVIALGRTSSGIPFGEIGGSLTDVFFLVACRDDRTHLSVLTRLTRL